MLLNGILHDFKGFQLVMISISFRDLDEELTEYLVNFLRRNLFRVIFQMAGLVPASEDVCSSTVMWSGRILTIFLHSDSFV